MGTRSLTFIYDGLGETVNGAVACMYRHMDGYPSGHGKELAEFLLPFKIVNGLGADEGPVANGTGCLAAQIVAHFKDGPGGIYLKSVRSTDCWQDYEYHIFVDGGAVFVRVKQNNGGGKRKKEIFFGNREEFLAFCSKKDQS